MIKNLELCFYCETHMLLTFAGYFNPGVVINILEAGRTRHYFYDYYHSVILHTCLYTCLTTHHPIIPQKNSPPPPGNGRKGFRCFVSILPTSSIMLLCYSRYVPCSMFHVPCSMLHCWSVTQCGNGWRSSNSEKFSFFESSSLQSNFSKVLNCIRSS